MSELALEFAVDEARFRSRSLLVLAVAKNSGAVDECREAAKHSMARALTGDATSVDARLVTAVGGAAEALVAQSEGAELLVVGATGRSALAGLLLGSVSQRCVQQARCPVTVVRPRSGARLTLETQGDMLKSGVYRY
jgi:nucleotide-binding universal stress UspA family protein